MANYNIDAIYNGSTSLPGTERIRIDGSGNVGINQSSPAYKLDVNGTARIANDMLATGNITIGKAAAYLILDGTNSDAEIYWRANSSNRWAAGMNVGDATENFNIYNYTTATTNFTILKANGNVGIGSTAPNDKLDVVGRVYAYRYIAVSSNASSPAYATDTSTGMFNAGTNIIGFSISGTEKLRIDSNGNVGIGTTSPAQKLDVAGSARFTNIVYAAKGILSDSSGVNPVLEVYNTVATNAATAIIRQTTAGGNGNQDIGLLVDIQGAGDSDRIANFRYYDGSTYTSRMAILRSGNVGIGTTSPAAKLDVIGSIRYSSNGNPVTEYAGIITTPDDYPTCTEKARIYTIGTINADGNSSSYLEVEVIGSHRGYVIGSYYEYKRWIITVGDRISSRLVFSSGVNFIGLWNGTDATGFKGQNGAPDLANGAVIKLIANPNCGAGFFYTVRVKYANLNLTQGPFTYTNHSVYSVAIPSSQYHLYEDTVVLASNSGNVGIGTSSPTNKLHIYSSANEPVLIQGTTGGTWLNFQSSTSNLLSIGADSTRGIGFYNRTTSADLMTISNGGNVGIGITVPAAKLHCYNGSSGGQVSSNSNVIAIESNGNNGLQFLNPSANNANINFGDQSDNEIGFIQYQHATDAMRFRAGGTTIMSLVSGNVGIGTTSPNRKLQVDAGTNGPALRLTNTNSNSGIELITAASTYSWLLGAQYNVGGAFEITPSTAVGGTTFSTPTAVFLQTGNVGIGTTSPNAKLVIDSGEPRFRLNISGANHIILNHDGSTAILRTESNTPFTFGTNGTEKMRIAAGGSVGIGTTNPSQALEVSGTVKATSYIGDFTGRLVRTSTTQTITGNSALTIDVAAAYIHIITVQASGGTFGISSVTYNNRKAGPEVDEIILIFKWPASGSGVISITNLIGDAVDFNYGKATVVRLTSYKGTGGLWICEKIASNIDYTNL